MRTVLRRLRPLHPSKPPKNKIIRISKEKVSQKKIRKKISRKKKITKPDSVQTKNSEKRLTKTLTVFHEIIENYLIYAGSEKGYATQTLISRKYHIMNFLAFLEKRDIRGLREVTKDHIIDYLECLMKSGKTASTRKDVLTAIKMFFRYLKREYILETNVALLIESPKLEDRIPKALHYSDIVSILEAIEQDEKPSCNSLISICEVFVPLLSHQLSNLLMFMESCSSFCETI
jgi:integrase